MSTKSDLPEYHEPLDDVAQRIASLSPAKRALLEMRLQKASVNVLREQIIPRRASGHQCPLSFSQQRLWFLSQFDPASPVYNVTRAIRLTGVLNVEALQSVLNTIVARHEVLRTTFAAVDGTPVQTIGQPRPVEFSISDVSQQSEFGREAHVREFTKTEAQRPFNLSCDLMLRSALLRLGEQEHVLVLTTHHIASDGWSSEVFLEEFAALYGAFSDGQPSPLPELPIQYGDFAVWQRESMQGELLNRQLSYWKERLRNAPALLELPLDNPRPKMQSFRGARQAIHLSNSLADRLRILSKQEGVTLFMTLLAAFKVLLFRYTGQEDVLVGVPVANRTRPETERLIGFFVNNLVLRTDLSGNPTFRELLSRVREVSLGAYAHQDLPFEKLVEELQPERSLGHTPLFQVMFGFQNNRREIADFPGLRVKLMGVDSGTAKFDLFLSVLEEADRFWASLEYNSDIFEDATIARMSRHFQVLLEGIARSAEQRISDLPLLTGYERRQLLVDRNSTTRAYPDNSCVHELFEAQVKRSPNAVAAVFNNEEVTYAELNRRANQLAHYMRQAGVGPEVLVGICVERSLDMLVAVLGILKAGGAYLPLDPSYPRERLAFMLEDSGATVLLTQSALLRDRPETGDGRPAFGPLGEKRKAHSAESSSPPGRSAVNGQRSVSVLQRSSVPGLRSSSETRSPVSSPRSVICLDTDWEFIARESADNTTGDTAPDNLAYVIYTSGSTGKPKGVQVPHRAVVNFLSSMRREPGLTNDDILASGTTLSFDIAALELFLPLCVGARLVLVGSEMAADGSRLAAFLESCGATVMQATPATWRLLMEAQWHPSHSFTALCGGESLPQDLADYLLVNVSSLWNMYGPTETTIWSAVNRVERSDKPICIGRPIDNTKLYILDPCLNPVPVGVPGELYIGGIGLARGYKNRPELAAEKFIPNPFGKELGTRLYRTGDRVRYRSSGEIEFLGRTDYQVKLRGFRIELGEIESVVRQHSAVQESVVLAREEGEETSEALDSKSAIQNQKSDKRLVAYVVPRQDAGLVAQDLRSFLKEKLPEYMVPSVVVFLDSLPLTPNGKIDRRRLPAPDPLRPELKEAYVAPRNHVEEMIGGIWAEVLNIPRVGVYDNFFDLGGHSLLATRLMSRIRERLRMELPLRVLFEKPNVAALSDHVDAIVSINKDTPAPLGKLSYPMEEITI